MSAQGSSWSAPFDGSRDQSARRTIALELGADFAAMRRLAEMPEQADSDLRADPPLGGPMEQESSTDRRVPSAAELEFRRYEARLGLWKVVLGTFIVGLAGVLIPGAINFYNAHFENARKETEL